jgi:hypothetical protein
LHGHSNISGNNNAPYRQHFGPPSSRQTRLVPLLLLLLQQKAQIGSLMIFRFFLLTAAG